MRFTRLKVVCDRCKKEVWVKNQSDVDGWFKDEYLNLCPNCKREWEDLWDEFWGDEEKVKVIKEQISRRGFYGIY